MDLFIHRSTSQRAIHVATAHCWAVQAVGQQALVKVVM